MHCRPLPQHGESSRSPAANIVFASTAGEANVSYEGAAGPRGNGRQKKRAEWSMQSIGHLSPDDVNRWLAIFSVRLDGLGVDGRNRSRKRQAPCSCKLRVRDAQHRREQGRGSARSGPAGAMKRGGMALVSIEGRA